MRTSLRKVNSEIPIISHSGVLGKMSKEVIWRAWYANLVFGV